MRSRHRLSVMTNILTPYRLPIYKALAKQFDTRILLEAPEDNRMWDIPTSGEVRLEVKNTWGITIKRRVKDADKNNFDLRYMHINLGHITELNRFRPEAIISTEMGLRSLVALVYGFVHHVPVWIWWGGTPHTERSRSASKRLIRQYVFAKYVERWISYGMSSTEYLTSLKIPTRKILQIQNCVDEELFGLPVEPLSIDLPHPRILIVGQLIRRKGIYQFLDAASKLQIEGISLSVIFVGNGQEADNLRHEAEIAGIHYFQIIEYLSPRAMPSVYKAADLMVFPTLEDVWGLVVNEALLAKLPVIASRYAGCAQELLHPDYLFDPLDQDEFVSVLRRALKGDLAASPVTNLWSIDDVSRIISREIETRLASGSKSRAH